MTSPISHNIPSTPDTRKLLVALLAIGALSSLPEAQASTGTWSQNAAGTFAWNNNTNWGGSAFPVAAGDTANLSIQLLGNETVNLTVPITIGALNIGDTNSLSAFTVAAGGGSLTMSSASGSAGTSITENLASKNDSISAGITIADTGGLTISNNNAAANTFTVSGGITSSSTGMNLVISNTNAGGTTFSTTSINNSGSITNSGAGAGGTLITAAIGSNVTGITQNSASGLTLGGVNSSTGGVTLTAGTLVIGNNSALGTGTFTINGGILAATGANKVISTNPSVVLNGDFSYNSAAFSTDLGTGAVSLGVNAGATRTITMTAGTLILGGVISNGTDPTTPTINLVKAGPGNLGLTGSNTFTGSVTVQGGGTLTLSGANAYAGTTSVLDGTLLFGAAVVSSANGPLGNSSGAVLLGNTTGTANATLKAAGAFNFGRNIVVQAGNTGIATVGSAASSGNKTYSGSITLGSSGTGHGLTFVAGGFVDTYTGLIQDPASLTGAAGLVTIGGGSSQFNNASNSYTGGTSIATGATLLLGNSSGGTTGVLGNNNNTLTMTGTAILDLNKQNQTVGNFTGTGGTVLNGSTSFTSGLRTLTIGSGNATGGNFGGSIVDHSGSSTGTVGITKIGTGTLTLSGASNSYTGPTAVNGGTLQINGTNSASATTVNTTGTLSGTGTVTGVTLADGGTIAPGLGGGATTGALTATSLTWNSVAGSTLTFNLDGASISSTKLTLTGALTKGTGSVFNINLSDSSALATAGTYHLVDFGSTTFTSTGQFTLVSSLTFAPGYSGSLFLDTAGNALEFQVLAVPEPGTWAMMLGGLGCLIALQRRRSKLD